MFYRKEVLVYIVNNKKRLYLYGKNYVNIINE